MKTSFIVILLLISLMICSGCSTNSITKKETVGDEYINATVSADVITGVYIALPESEGQSYCVFASTVARGTPEAELEMEYGYPVSTQTTDKFGTYFTNTTGFGQFSIGITNDKDNVDKIVKVPDTATSSNIHIFKNRPYRGGIYTENTPETVVNIVIKRCAIPEKPIPPEKGSIVNCSNYTRLDASRIWTSSDGNRWFDAPGNPDYYVFKDSTHSLYLTTKYTGYTFPANLSVINGTPDTCKVI